MTARERDGGESGELLTPVRCFTAVSRSCRHFLNCKETIWFPAVILKRKSFYIYEQRTTVPNELTPYLEQPDIAALKCLN